MLNWFLRSIRKDAPKSLDRQPTYLERLLDEVRKDSAARIRERDLTDPLASVGLDIVALEPPSFPRYEDREFSERHQFARSWLSVLIENDQLPPALQLPTEELTKPRALLSSFFFGSQNIQAEAQQVLRFVEKKYNDGSFSQVSMLLKLFDTDEVIRRNNERNIFYEQMLLRLMSQRDRPVPTGPLQEYASIVGGAGVDGFAEVAQWLALHADVRLHVQARHAQDVAAWETAVESLDPVIQQAVLEQIPPWRWRPIFEFGDVPFVDLVTEHLAAVGITAYIIDLMRSIYFIVLSTGRTGYERLIIEFVHLLDRRFNCTSTRVLPDLHSRCTLYDEGISEGLQNVFELYLIDMNIDESVFEAANVKKALERIITRFETLDINSVPAGDYDIGGIVFDELIGFEYESFEHSLRLHRLT